MSKVIEPFKDYLANEAMGSGSLKSYIDHPAKFHADREGRLDRSSKALEFGSAAHDYLLCEGAHTALVPDLNLRTKAGKAQYELLKETHENVVRGEDVKILKGMKEAIVRDSADFMSLVKGSEVETSWYATCPETGLRLKCRPDVLNIEKKAKIDLKTTKDAQGFFWEIHRHKYYIQRAFHTYVLTLNGVEIDIDGWFSIEKTEPYLHGLVLEDEESRESSHKYMMEALHKLKEDLDDKEPEKVFSSRLDRIDYHYSPHL